MILGRTGFARKGEWTVSAVYDMLDIVTHEGKEYIGKRNSTGSEPSPESADWVMLPDAPGFEIEETVSGYDLTITGSDGTSETISILNGEVDREELEDALESFQSSADAYFASDYDDEAVYSAGDYCIYEGLLYRCKENILTAEPWTAEHWERAVLADKLTQMRKDAEVKADVVVSSAEPGDVVSFDDGADAPVRELVVGVEPVQDLHGQANPYPAGGGKNKLQNLQTTQTISGVTFTVYSDGSVNVNGTATELIVFTLNDLLNNYLNDDTNYILSGSPSNSDTSKWKLRVYNRGTDYIDSGLGVNIHYFSDTTQKCDIVVYSGTTMNNVLIKPMIRLATVADATFAPYSNVCPISGWTGVEVYQKGFNLWDEEWKMGHLVSGEEVSDGTYRLISKNYIPVVPGQDHCFTAPKGKGVTIYGYYADKQYRNGLILDSNRTYNDFNVISIPDDCYYIKFQMYASYGSSSSSTYNNDICINFSGSRNGEYEPYKGKPVVPISWQSSAGTVYGGSLDVTTGVLTVSMGMVDMGDLTWTFPSPNKFFRADLPNVKDGVGASGMMNAICEMYRYETNGSAIYSGTADDCFNVNSGYIGNPSAGVVYVRDSSYSTSSDFKTAMNGVKLVYELKNYQTYQLTPTQIATLLGTNVFWSNSNGGIQSLRYVSDLKLYLEQLTKPTEDDMVASSNIPANTYFTIGNALYLSTAAIAAGEKIEPDTNCIRKSLADALNDLQDQ